MNRLKKWNVKIFYSDHWDVYSKIIPRDKLQQSKSETVSIERNNGRQRHWFARFRRKSIVVSKSLEMVDLTMALFARFHVNGQREEILSLFGQDPPKFFQMTCSTSISVYPQYQAAWPNKCLMSMPP